MTIPGRDTLAVAQCLFSGIVLRDAHKLKAGRLDTRGIHVCIQSHCMSPQMQRPTGMHQYLLTRAPGAEQSGSKNHPSQGEEGH